ncbi:hypothetical protein KFE25_008813 [Diacronema lutheri]|uniref:Uncharacterized protein n=1 Tax=Diacronema lutheri TaxID=2081491 RepID=A0A8J6CCY9_DIALT|nr:hypothetical protein KFE25_008813 [Diacronema lutheri]
MWRRCARTMCRATCASLVSWEEFRSILGGAQLQEVQPSKQLAASGPPVPSPAVSGTMTIELEGGGKMEVDAAKYLAELRESVRAMKAELAQASAARPGGAGSIGNYLAALPRDELQTLTGGMKPDVAGAMKQLVDHVVKGTFETEQIPPPGTVVAISRDALAQVCMWQLILGYRVRQAEAKGEAQQRLGF